MGGTVNVNLPNPVDTSSTVSGGLDFGLDNIQITALPTIVSQLAVTQLPTIVTQLAVTELPQIDIGITQLPQINIGITQLPLIQTQLSLKPTRVHLPINLKFTVCALGRELLSFGICGESMVIVEDYVPHRLERCA